MNTRPLKDRVIVKPDPIEEKNIGGLTLVDEKKQLSGVVVAIGKLTEEVWVGCKIIFGKYAGVEITIEEEDYLIMKEDDILACKLPIH